MNQGLIKQILRHSECRKCVASYLIFQLFFMTGFCGAGQLGSGLDPLSGSGFERRRSHKVWWRGWTQE